MDPNAPMPILVFCSHPKKGFARDDSTFDGVRLGRDGFVRWLPLFDVAGGAGEKGTGGRRATRGC